MPAAIFRCDGGPEMGIGHVVRCRAMAAAFGALGWRCTFAVTLETTAYLSGPDVIVVPPGLAGAAAVAAAGRERKFDSLIVDHYGLDAGFEAAARGTAAVVVAVDDLANRAHRCDVLLDSNPERTPADYGRLVAGDCRFLLGLKHALLRPEFTASRPAVERPAPRHAERLLIVLGGSDPGRASERVLQALPYLGGPAMQVTLVIGPANPRRDTLAGEAERLGARVAVDPPDLPELMATADLAITSASTSCLELACLGIPALLLVTAQNQRELAAALDGAGAAELLGESAGLDPKRIAAAVTALGRDRELRTRMTRAGRELVDGQGSRRAAGVIAELVSFKQREMHS